ncbi:MAG TPA: LLM class flavin-dependent oxidoreductase [Baekduia sp.]|nr:LLM class flavin-dependent oxidoreductase [Baekduia sp.]
MAISQIFDRQQHVELARRAETASLSALWHIEQCFDSFVYDQLSLTSTDMLLSGSCVAVRNKRHPVQAAETATTINHISDGRFILGLGTGVYKPHNGQPEDRLVGRMSEYIDIFKQVTTGEPLDFHGDFYDAVFGTGEEVLDHVPSEPIPVYIAAGGPLMQRLAGRKCDGTFIHFGSRAMFREQVDTIRSAAVEAGRDPDAVKIAQLTPICVDEDSAAARKSLRRYLTDYLHRPYYRKQLAAAGFPEEAEEIERLIAAGEPDAAAAAISDAALDEIGLAGTPGEVAERFDAFFVDGVDDAVLYPSPLGYGEDPDADWLEMCLRTMEIGEPAQGAAS